MIQCRFTRPILLEFCLMFVSFFVLFFLTVLDSPIFFPSAHICDDLLHCRRRWACVNPAVSFLFVFVSRVMIDNAGCLRKVSHWELCSPIPISDTDNWIISWYSVGGTSNRFKKPFFFLCLSQSVPDNHGFRAWLNRKLSHSTVIGLKCKMSYSLYFADHYYFCIHVKLPWTLLRDHHVKDIFSGSEISPTPTLHLFRKQLMTLLKESSRTPLYSLLK